MIKSILPAQDNDCLLDIIINKNFAMAIKHLRVPLFCHLNFEDLQQKLFQYGGS